MICERCGGVLGSRGDGLFHVGPIPGGFDLHEPVTGDGADWTGYRRDPEVTAWLLDALHFALYAHPEQRLGQLLVNLGGVNLWNIHDEKWIKLLRGPDA